MTIFLTVLLVAGIVAYRAVGERDREIKRLNNLVSEHHADDVMAGLRIGDPCPICAPKS